MTYHHNAPSRVTNRTTCSPRATIVFYSLLDALAFILGVLLGGLALGRMMALYFFGV